MESFYDRGNINLNNKEKLIQDNYSKVNQISARCMRVIVAILALAFVYCYFGTDMDESVLIVFFASDCNAHADTFIDVCVSDHVIPDPSGIALL